MWQKPTHSTTTYDCSRTKQTAHFASFEIASGGVFRFVELLEKSAKDFFFVEKKREEKTHKYKMLRAVMNADTERSVPRWKQFPSSTPFVRRLFWATRLIWLCRKYAVLLKESWSKNVMRPLIWELCFVYLETVCLAWRPKIQNAKMSWFRCGESKNCMCWARWKLNTHRIVLPTEHHTS